MILKCGMCDTKFKKGDTVYEQVKTIYQGRDETYPVEVISRWCEDCEIEMQKRVEDNLHRIEQTTKGI